MSTATLTAVASDAPELRTAPLVEHRSLDLVEARFEEDGTFAGWANLTEGVDSYGTRFSADAWTSGGLDDKPYALLFMHAPGSLGTVVGAFTARMRTDDAGKSGLWIEGRFANTQAGNEARELAKIGAAAELSVGFVRLKADPKDKNRIISARLVETSLIVARMASQPGAALTDIRAADSTAVPVETPVADSREQRVTAPLTGSYEELQQACSIALNAWALGAFGRPDSRRDWWTYLEATFPDRVVAAVSTYADGRVSRGFWQLPYTVQDGQVILGEATEVKINVSTETRSDLAALIAGQTAGTGSANADGTGPADARVRARAAAAALRLTTGAQ